MFYRRRIEEIFEKTSEKNREKREEIFGEEDDYDLDQYKHQVHLEPGDLFAMIIGGYYAFWPIFLALFIILFLVRPPW